MLENTGDSDPIELALFIHFGECATNSLDGTVSGERDTSLPPTERLRLLFPASDGGRGDGVGVGEGVGLALNTEVVIRTWLTSLFSSSALFLSFASFSSRARFGSSTIARFAGRSANDEG